MIQVSEGLRQELNSQIRQNLEYEAVVSLVDQSTYDLLNYDFSYGSQLDDICGTLNYAGVSKAFDYSVRDKFNGFTDFEQNTYDTFNPKKLYREPSAEEEIDSFDYLNMYSSRIYSKSFYNSPTTESNPFFEFITELYEPTAIYGLTINFGEEPTIYPTKMVIEFQNASGNKIESKTFIPSGIYFSEKFNVAEVSKIKIKILEMSRTEVKLRISSIMLGYEESFKDRLISIQCQRSSNPLSTELPKNKVSISLYDFDGNFDAQNPNGLYYLLASATVLIYCTYNGFRILLGTYTAYESPNSEGHKVSFNCSGRLESFGIYDSINTEGYTGMSLFDLIETSSVPLDKTVEKNFELNIPMYNLSRDYTFVNDSPQKVYSKVSNCLFGIFTEDTRGNITLKPSLKPNEIPKVVTKLKDELICGEIKVDTSTPIPNGIKINLYGAGTGNKLYALGEGNFIVDNNYVIGEDIVQYMVDTYNWWVDGTQKYEIPYMADPTIEIGDFVKFRNKYGIELVGIVAENNYSLPTSPGSDNLVVYTIKNKE